LENNTSGGSSLPDKKLTSLLFLKRVDTCAAEFESFTPYMYSTYEDEDESEPTAKPKL